MKIKKKGLLKKTVDLLREYKIKRKLFISRKIQQCSHYKAELLHLDDINVYNYYSSSGPICSSFYYFSNRDNRNMAIWGILQLKKDYYLIISRGLTHFKRSKNWKLYNWAKYWASNLYSNLNTVKHTHKTLPKKKYLLTSKHTLRAITYYSCLLTCQSYLNNIYKYTSSPFIKCREWRQE